MMMMMMMTKLVKRSSHMVPIALQELITSKTMPGLRHRPKTSTDSDQFLEIFWNAIPDGWTGTVRGV